MFEGNEKWQHGRGHNYTAKNLETLICQWMSHDSENTSFTKNRELKQLSSDLASEQGNTGVHNKVFWKQSCISHPGHVSRKPLACQLF